MAAMDGLLQLPYDVTVKMMLSSLERNLLPDLVVRRSTRLLLAGRLRSGYKPSSEDQLSDLLSFVHCNCTCPCHFYFLFYLYIAILNVPLDALFFV